MTNVPDPSPDGAAVAHLAVQVAALRAQVRLINEQLNRAGLTGDVSLADRFDQLAATVTDTLSSGPAGPAAPYWIGLTDAEHATQLTDLRQWTDTVLRTQYQSYPLRGCWANHPHAIWELSTLAAEWHRTYTRKRPSLNRALDFYDRWLPNAMRRIGEITRPCNPECVTIRRTRTPGRTPQP